MKTRHRTVDDVMTTGNQLLSNPRPAPGRFEPMPQDECVKRLLSNDLGRLALVDNQVRPIIFPVNYFFDEGIVAFRTAPGTKMDLAPGAYACFEIDGWAPYIDLAWSVLVTGTAHDITNPRNSPTGRVRFWPVRPLAPGSREHWIAISAEEITGRWFRKALRTDGIKS